MSTYEEFSTPSPDYPTPSPLTLPTLLAAWEKLRELNEEGYLPGDQGGGFLIDVKCEGGRLVQSRRRGLTCSPFTAQAVLLAYSDAATVPYEPKLVDGRAVPLKFYSMSQSDWPRPIIYYNMGVAVEPTDMQRGDAVHIDWISWNRAEDRWKTGGGHAVFCWDVHRNKQGEVDAFLFVSSNGSLNKVDGKWVGDGLGISVGGTARMADPPVKPIAPPEQRYKATRTPLFVDDEAYVAEGNWVTWNTDLTVKDLADCRLPPTRLKFCQKPRVARFHTMERTPSYAQGAPPRTDVPPSSDLLMQQQLRVLFQLGLVHVDVGTPDGKLGPQTKKAVRDFQTINELTADGIPGKKTRDKLAEIYAQAAATPAGQKLLATGASSIAQTAEPSEGGEGTAEGQPATSFSVEGDDGDPRVRGFYFRHGAVRAHETIEVVLLTSPELEGEKLQLSLRDATTGEIRVPATTIQIAADHTRVRLPVGAAAGALHAYLDELKTSTLIPLEVLAEGPPTAAV